MNRITRIVTTGLAGITLATGLGLAGAGSAQADTGYTSACVTVTGGTTTIKDHANTLTVPVRKDTACAINGYHNGAGGYTLAGAYVNDPNHPGFVSGSQPDILVDNLWTYGDARVRVRGPIRWGGGIAPGATAITEVPLTASPGGHYWIHDVTVDGAGRVADTTVYFDYTAYKA